MSEVRDMEHDREELIKRRAYAIWEQEGRPDGEHQRHWEQAAREMEGQGTPSPNGGDSLETEGTTNAVSTPKPPTPRTKNARNGARAH
ncbi:DUF2934 domain-containing protein [Sinorhizobium americanum]|uniref:DUF2934 domain-containing protein n=1 Tax=Sinorhizobium americanum TaxID=194963 RepID=UPI00137A5C99|nr:DUF2934 domain-containing protein [Sinorhizobium americanum]